MNQVRYQELLQNIRVINYSSIQGGYYVTESNSFIVSFVFIHAGWGTTSSGELRKRIKIDVFEKFNDGIEIPTILLERRTTILANADSPDYAFTFILTINDENKTAHVIIDEMPELGSAIMTKDEKNGTQTTL